MQGGTCPPNSGKKFVSGNFCVKFGHFVNFSYIFFGQKCRANLKLTELLRLCITPSSIHCSVAYNVTPYGQPPTQKKDKVDGFTISCLSVPLL